MSHLSFASSLGRSLIRELLLTSDFLPSAQQCYTDNLGVFDCTYFTKNNLPSKVDNSAPCPFPGEICRSDSSNILLDSGYIDSVKDQGMNGPKDESIQFRTVLHCAPLKTQGYVSNQATPANNYTQYHYGPLMDGSTDGSGLENQNATITVESTYSQYAKQEENPWRFPRNLLLG